MADTEKVHLGRFVELEFDDPVTVWIRDEPDVVDWERAIFHAEELDELIEQLIAARAAIHARELQLAEFGSGRNG